MEKHLLVTNFNRDISFKNIQNEYKLNRLKISTMEPLKSYKVNDAELKIFISGYVLDGYARELK